MNSRRTVLRWCRAWLLAGLALVGLSVSATPPRVGVFYFPGWKAGAVGLVYPEPWRPIQAFPEREPWLGWYDEGQVSVMVQQLKWMQGHGLDFVVFDWYWGTDRPVLDHALKAYQQAPSRPDLPYALMWANHGAGPKALADFRAMAQALVTQHFARADYLRVDGRPVFYVQVPENLEARAQALGSHSTALLAELDTLARQAGLPGVLLVAGAGGGRYQVTQRAKAWGYSAFFTYNYHAGIAGRTLGEQRVSRSYAELDAGYREHWNWFMSQADLPYVVPMTAGWDKRPWGGSSDPLHDLSSPTDQEFLAHLKAARAVLQAHPEKTLNMGVICCWNEFGEGSYIEPTKAQGFRRLQAVKAVFP
jgi:hypothetical protein